MISNNAIKADILNQYFSSVFIHEDKTSTIPTLDDRNDSNFIPEIDISVEMILRKLLHLDISKSMGPDNLHPYVLREVAKEISFPLSIIYNRSLQSGILPNDWCKANVTAIFKKGNRADACNYRPISLTCVLCKIMESILKDHLMLFLESYDLISESQNGFRNGRSCVTQLLEVMEEFTRLIDEKNDIDVVCLDSLLYLMTDYFLS